MRFDDLDRVLADDWLGDVTELAMDELRSRRTECQELEVGLSYQRRMAQGRLDIVGAERRRRATGEAPADAEHLLDQLRDILADRTRAPGVGRLPQLMAPEAAEVDTTALDAIVGPGRLAALPELSDDELDEVVAELSAFEARVSTLRRRLHERIDVLQAELTRRYRTGEASVDTLLQ